MMCIGMPPGTGRCCISAPVNSYCPELVLQWGSLCLGLHAECDGSSLAVSLGGGGHVWIISRQVSPGGYNFIKGVNVLMHESPTSRLWQQAQGSTRGLCHLLQRPGNRNPFTALPQRQLIRIVGREWVTRLSSGQDKAAGAPVPHIHDHPH